MFDAIVKKEESPREKKGNKRRENIESRETKHIVHITINPPHFIKLFFV
jgi:hypothetical protein